MNKGFIKKETSKIAIKKGFTPVDGYWRNYEDNYERCRQSEVREWLKKEHEINIWIKKVEYENQISYSHSESNISYRTLEEALEGALTYSLNQLKDKIIVKNDDKAKEGEMKATPLALDDWQSTMVASEMSSKQIREIPFKCLEKSLRNVFEILHTKRCDIIDYKYSDIPFEITEALAFSNFGNNFNKIQIWSDQTHPYYACIGIKKKWANSEGGEYIYDSAKEALKSTGGINKEHYLPERYQTTYYLIARWSDVEITLDELKEVAIEEFTDQEIRRFARKIKEIEKQVDGIKRRAFKKFN